MQKVAVKFGARSSRGRAIVARRSCARKNLSAAKPDKKHRDDDERAPSQFRICHKTQWQNAVLAAMAAAIAGARVSASKRSAPQYARYAPSPRRGARITAVAAVGRSVALVVVVVVATRTRHERARRSPQSSRARNEKLGARAAQRRDARRLAIGDARRARRTRRTSARAAERRQIYFCAQR